ncbi:hypothetical protein C7B61_07805 [filamentous cyanobacterium CCP1]|nr:hypothetical protein C7B76_14055 [filamentous cyanobacterium CCP2]PSB67126.1 hypothetical protein C7B61_07805 [filamentous cyanobacterium CCP1]
MAETRGKGAKGGRRAGGDGHKKARLKNLNLFLTADGFYYELHKTLGCALELGFNFIFEY